MQQQAEFPQCKESGKRQLTWPSEEEKRNSDIAFQEINQEFESQRFQLHQARRWADQAQRDKIILYGELELRHRLFQEHHARDCQEIEELRRARREECNRARQARIDELIVYASREESYDSESNVDSDSAITEQSKFLVRRKRLVRS